MITQTNAAYFEQIESAIRSELLHAKSSVKLCVAWIRWDRFAWVFDRLSERGVAVDLIYDNNESNQKSLRALPPTVRRFPVNNGRYLMHNKFCIIDDETVITGSYNWSANAWNHFENIVVVKNDFKLLLSFLHEFEDLKWHSGSQADEPKVCSTPSCKSHTFNLAMMGEDTGPYENAALTVWEVCNVYGHARYVGDVHIDHLRVQLGLVDQPEYEGDEEEYGKGQMMHDFGLSRRINERFDQLASNLNIPVHAVGERFTTNATEVIEWEETPEERIFMHWRHMHYRKRIPPVYPQDDIDCEDIDRILRGF